ncbi:DUF4124 domain-containing protein [Solilutibacter silvestris]|uniref:DUF4124 domain-containing protein n=1 Tax=Solilutibacter silvestris TaxID=1645665 RepID=A0A2K1Q0U4_9GAMM|nr:DUF4124 domain-containing protein [Lysobacter silvestris]PNS08527.1 hypothetical protein Lysil_0156 [Lysobacter silvestris]
MRALPAIALLLLSACACAQAAQNDVTVYRCTDARGQIELRDTPCLPSQHQQERQMLRPKDPPRSTATPLATPAPRDTVREVHYVLRQPRPLYECSAPDGSSYTSESAEGNARWQPAWIAAPPWGLVPPIVPLSGGASVSYHDRHTSIQVGGGRQIRPVHPGIAYGGGMWVHDSCAPMPQERACAALTQQRDDLRRGNVLRQPSEQARLDAQESSVNARLRDECGG